MTEEDRIQINCVEWFDMQHPELSLMLMHIPNGGKRARIMNKRGQFYCHEGKKLKKMGVRAGAGDLLLAIANDEFHGMFIEMKTPTGTQSREQKIFQFNCIRHNYKYVVARSLEMFIDEVKKYLSSTKFKR